MGLDEKSLIRKDAKKSSKKKWYIGAAVLCAVIAIGNIGQFIVDNTIGRFPDIYQAIDFNNDFEQEDILDIIYGDTTAMVLYEMVAGTGMQCYYQDDGLWVYSGLRTQIVDFEIGNLIIMKTEKGEDWCVSVRIYPEKNKGETDTIADNSDGTFQQYNVENRLLRSYFSYIHPDSSRYEISINGTTYEVDLKYYNAK